MKFTRFFFTFALFFSGIFLHNAEARMKNIAIIGVGGTISGAGDSAIGAKYSASKLAIDKVVGNAGDITKLANIRAEQLMQVGSEDLNNVLWLKIAKRVNEVLSRGDVDGVVITHGTDTLEETAYFLNLVVKSKKPVVLVGAMRPSTSLSADGPMNLYNAVAVASSDVAFGKGVLVVFNDNIFAARDVTKAHTTNPAAFQSNNFAAIGYVNYGKTEIYYSPSRIHTTQSIFDVRKLNELPKVDIIYAYANHEGSVIDQLIASGAKAIIVASVGDGNIYKDSLQKLITAKKQGIFVVKSARTGAGVVFPNVEIDDDGFGFVTADNLNPQKARILMMLALTKTQNLEKIKKIFATY